LSDDWPTNSDIARFGVHDSERDLQGCGLICAAAVLTLVIVSRLILFLSEPLQHLIARGARNLLAMVSWQYDLKTIEYIDGGLGVGSLMGIFCSRVGPFARDSERFVIRLLIRRN